MWVGGDGGWRCGYSVGGDVGGDVGGYVDKVGMKVCGYEAGRF